MTRILVVDDSPTIRRVVTHILEVSGFDTVEAVDGQDALDVLKSGEAKVDLVLLDFVMPRMNGFQFARALRQEADFSALPVILMSAKSDRIRQQFVEQTGSFDAIAKPFDADALLTVVQNAFNRKNDRPTAPRLPESGNDDDVIVLDSIPPEEAITDDGTGDATILRAASPVAILASQLREILSPLVPQMAEPDFARKMELALTNEVVRDLARVATELSRTEPVVLSGDLGVLPIGGILQLLQSEGQTGRLIGTNNKGEITVTFRGGLIDLVQSKGAGDEFRIGRYFVEAGVVKPEQIELLARGEPIKKETVDLPAKTEEVAIAGDDATPLAPAVMSDLMPGLSPELSISDTIVASPDTKKSNGVTGENGETGETLVMRSPIEAMMDKTDDDDDDDAPVADDAEKAEKEGPSSSVVKSGARAPEADDYVSEPVLVDPPPEEDDLNVTRIGAMAFKREVEMPQESAPTIVGEDELEVIDEPTPLGIEGEVASGDIDDDDDDDDDDEVLSSRDLQSMDSSPPQSSPKSPAATMEGPTSARESKPLPFGVREIKPHPTNEVVTPRPPRLLLGDALLQAGLVTEQQLREALVRQSSELVYELLRWQKGHFELVRAAPTELANKTKLGLPVAQVVMEGFRRVDEWRALEASVGSFESVIFRDDVVARTMKDDAITRSERRVLDAVDGERTVREVIAATHLSSFDACRILAQFLEARIVRRHADESA